MIKNSLLTMMLATLLWGCGQSYSNMDVTGGVPATTIDDTPDKLDSLPKVIMPGQGVGTIKLYTSLDSAKLILGNPDREDAAMGSAFVSWYGDHNKASHSKFQIYGYNKAGKDDPTNTCIKKIRITSPEFKTKEQVGAGSTLAEISKKYNVTPSPNPPFKDQNKLYDDLKDGIGFEIKPDNTCSAVVVHAPGDNTLTYINLK